MDKQLLRRRNEAKKRIHKNYEVHLRLYEVYQKFFLLRSLVKRIEKGLALSTETNEKHTIYRIVNVSNGLIVLYLLLISSFYSLTQNAMYSLLFLIFLWFLVESYLDYFITRSHYRLLEQLSRFIGLVRQKFYEYKTVDEAIYEALQCMETQDREMMILGEKIYDLFVVTQREVAMEKFLQIAPDAFIKIFVNLSFMTYEYGDKISEGQSVYQNNLSFILKNLRLEIDKRKRLNYALKSMNFIVVIPLFLLSVMKNWAVHSFAMLGKFYDSALGEYVEIATIIVIFLAMLLLQKIQNVDGVRQKDFRIKKILDRIPIPLTSELKIQWFLTFGVFLASLVIMMGVQSGNQWKLKDKVYYEDSFLGAQLDNLVVTARKVESNVDYSFVKEYAKEYFLHKERGEEDVIQEQIQLWIQEHPMDGQEMGREKRIIEKIEQYKENSIQWWQIVLCVAFAAIAYHLPILQHRINIKITAMDMEDEVVAFRSIIIMLMQNESLGVYEILEWLENYAIYYKEVLYCCLMEFSSGGTEALQNLWQKVKNEDMKKIAFQLMMAADDISIREAFDEVLQEKANFLEDRKWRNEKLIEKKILLGNNIGFLPTYCMIIFYLILPMVYTSANELERFFRQVG
ncbi:MAG: hypothetical protein JW708_02120 [Vallitaleaceae bacterium]|nr:hypothetical protein [Vallitaleaceae bacterium]